MTQTQRLVGKIEEARELLFVIKSAAERIATGNDDGRSTVGIATLAEHIEVLLADAIDEFIGESIKPTIVEAA